MSEKTVDQYTPAPDLLAGRTILITGAGDGIGRTAALTFADHKTTVILLGRTAKKLEHVYDQIEQAGNPRPAIVTLDLSRATVEDYEKLAKTVEDELGHLDGLIHNAAELGTLTPLALYDLGTWSKVFTVNVHAVLLLTRACLPLLSKSKDASIVFTSADVGRQGRAYWGAYGVTCFAVEGMMQTLAAELEANTANTLTTADALNERLAWARSAGYAWGYEEFADGINSVAAPVFGPSGVEAALHVHGPSYRFPNPDHTHDIGLIVAEAAARLSTQLQEYAD